MRGLVEGALKLSMSHYGLCATQAGKGCVQQYLGLLIRRLTPLLLTIALPMSLHKFTVRFLRFLAMKANIKALAGFKQVSLEGNRNGFNSEPR